MIYILLIIALILTLILFFNKVFLKLEPYVKVKVYIGFVMAICTYSIISNIIAGEKFSNIYLLFSVVMLFLSAVLFFTIKKK